MIYLFSNLDGVMAVFRKRTNLVFQSYHADTETRLARFLENRLWFLTRFNHLQEGYFGQQSISQWTVALAEDNLDNYPNSYAR